MIKINLKDVTVLNSSVYFNNKALKYMKKTNKTARKKGTTAVVGDFSTPFAINSRKVPEHQEMTKDVVELNDTISQLGLMGIHGALYTIAAEYTFFKCIKNIYQDR